MSKQAVAEMPQPVIDRHRPPVFTDSDETLATYVERLPGSVETAQCAATAAWTRARQTPGFGHIVDNIWNDVKYQSSNRSAGAGPVLLRIALETEALFFDLIELNAGTMGPLVPLFGQPTYAGFPNTEPARAALMSRPGSAHYLRKFDAKVAAEEEKRRIENERYMREDAPRVFLNCVRARGVDLQLSPEGDLIAPPGTNISVLLPSERQAIKDWKSELVALLKAEAASAAGVAAEQPLVLA